MSKADFEYSLGFVVDSVQQGMARALEDDVIVILIDGSNDVTFIHHLGTQNSVAAWEGATGVYDPLHDRIDGVLPHSVDPMDGEHAYSITLDRGPLSLLKRPRIHVRIAPRVGGPAADDGSWSGSGSPPPLV